MSVGFQRAIHMYIKGGVGAGAQDSTLCSDVDMSPTGREQSRLKSVVRVVPTQPLVPETQDHEIQDCEGGPPQELDSK